MSVPDEVHLEPVSGTTLPPHKRLLVYFVTGNPGLIGYYADFMRHIQKRLVDDGGQDRDVIFYGSSLDGFEVNGPSDPTIKLPLSLPEQISRVRRRLDAKVQEIAGHDVHEAMPVVLVGHSVGSYILMEVIAQWQQESPGQKQSWWPAGGICLFPTVTEIAQSPKGRQLSWLLGLPSIADILHTVSRIFHFIPRLPVLDWAVLLNPGQLHVEVTAAMIRSREGVRQLLYMANDEMKLITEDRWLPELWGVTAQSVETGSDRSTTKHKLKLYFFWGHSDYWIDNEIRDALIRKRASRPDITETKDWPHMEIAENRDIEHCFSLNSEHVHIVADKVAGHLSEIRRRTLS